jgi:hypothetical protein
MLRTSCALAAVLLSAPMGSAQSVDPPKSQTERIKELETKVETLQSWLEVLNGYTGDRSVVLDCDAGKFSAIMPKSNTLVFLAACNKVEPYLEGYRITIAIGNPLSMAFSGVSGELGYGETAVKSFAQKQPFSTTAALRPGIWTPIQVTINPAAAKDVRVIRLTDFAFVTASAP